MHQRLPRVILVWNLNHHASTTTTSFTAREWPSAPPVTEGTKGYSCLGVFSGIVDIATCGRSKFVPLYHAGPIR